MLTQAFYTGISGLRTNQTAIDVLSDNLANVSTVGFRAYTTEFSSLFEETLTTTVNKTSVDSSVGVGVQASATVMDQSNGSILLSDRSTDIAIDGDGWFGIVGNGQPLYTRDGAFTFDVNRDLVTYDGFHILGTKGGNISNGVLTSQNSETLLGDIANQEKLNFPNTLTFPPQATSKASFFANIGIVDEIRTISAGVVDGQGNKNNLKLTFQQSAVQTPPGVQWDVVATTKSLDGVILNGVPVPPTTYDTQTGTVNFDAGGALLSTTLSSIDNNGSSVEIDLGTGYAGITSINLPPTSGSSLTDGKQGGDLVGYDINSNAEVIATFSNGEQSSVAKIALFHFQNDQGLNRINGSRFQESNNSGKAIFFQDATGANINGTNMQNFRLEGSNVQLAAGLTDLIIYQRSYDANSKSITTANEMMQKALSMDA